MSLNVSYMSLKGSAVLCMSKGILAVDKINIGTWYTLVDSVLLFRHHAWVIAFKCYKG